MTARPPAAWPAPALAIAASGAPLRVILPTEAEQAAHLERIAGIVKKSGKSLWTGELPAPAA